MARVLVTFKLNEEFKEILERSGESFSIYSGSEPFESWFERESKDAVVAIVFPGQPFGEKEILQSPKLKLIIVHGSGLDKVDIRAASSRGVCVANAPDEIAVAVAEHSLALTMAALRKITVGDSIIREGKWVRGIQSSLTGRSIKALQVGVVGLGRIGSEAARIFSSLGSRVVYWDRRRKPEIEHALGITYAGLEDLFKTSDVIIVSIALTEQTRRIIGEREINSMKRGALLVNVSRGQVIDERALIERLKKEEIYAALDVFEEEPIGKDHPLSQLRNTVLTPHVAGFTYEALNGTSKMVIEWSIDFLRKGKLPYTVVNLESCSSRL
ncbi:MAG: 2-hydroxyacid dehydrogenase [Fervidicoccaceae archaeon]